MVSRATLEYRGEEGFESVEVRKRAQVTARINDRRGQSGVSGAEVNRRKLRRGREKGGSDRLVLFRFA